MDYHRLMRDTFIDFIIVVGSDSYRADDRQHKPSYANYRVVWIWTWASGCFGVVFDRI